MSDDFGTVDTHESYGLIGFSRVSSSHNANFFGSSIRCNHWIELHISRASRRRNLNTYWYHNEQEIIELRLSPNQFAELLTTMNVGSGVPCTLQTIEGHEMAECPALDQRAIFEDEFTKDVAASIEETESLLNEIKEMFAAKTAIGQKDRASIVKKLDQMVMHIKNNMPFVQSQFNEAMDKTVVEAKSEVEAFINNKIHSLGLAALNEDVEAALNAPLESEPLQLTSKN